MSKKCPICGKEGTTGKPFSPFCSERCKLIDLGNWASGEYKISRKLEADELSELEAELFINENNKPSNN